MIVADIIADELIGGFTSQTKWAVQPWQPEPRVCIIPAFDAGEPWVFLALWHACGWIEPVGRVWWWRAGRVADRLADAIGAGILDGRVR